MRADDTLYNVDVIDVEGQSHSHPNVFAPERDPSGALALFHPNQEAALVLYAPGMWRAYTASGFKSA